MAEKISGIYRIVCIKNGRYYYGSAVNIHLRWGKHKSRLRNRKHENPIMQRVWNKHGENTFRIDLVEKVLEKKLLSVEQSYLNEHVGKSNCMNVTEKAGAPPRPPKGICPSNLEWLHKQAGGMKGKTHSFETCKKMSDAKKGKKNHFYGKRHTKEARKKIREARVKQVNISQKKLSKNQILEIKTSNLSQRALAIRYGVSQKTIWTALHV